MPVILMDPALPDLIPAHGVSYLSGHVFVTEEVHPKLLWDLPSYEYVSAPRELPPGSVVLTSDREHPLVRQQIAHGDELIGGQTVTGTRLLEAVALMDRLRRTGPWEKQQTHDSLRRYLLEEVYELLDAFDGDDSSELCSELGDLLLQVLFHARIAEDSAVGAFDIDDVAQSFISKVSYRTPGVLAGEHADIERQINEWEERKAAERSRGSVLDGLVTAQPALSLTQKLFERLGAAGFPRDAISPNLTRVDIPVRKHARESVEDNLRRAVLTLMRQVRAAENAAGVDGVVPRDENTWRKYLGMSYDDAELDEEIVPSLVEPGDEGARVETPSHRGLVLTLASWKLMLDSGRLQDGEPHLAGTARPSVVRLSPATAERLGCGDQDPVSIATDRGELTLPLAITDMHDDVVWLPLNSPGSHVYRTLAAVPGEPVTVRSAR